MMNRNCKDMKGEQNNTHYLFGTVRNNSIMKKDENPPPKETSIEKKCKGVTKARSRNLRFESYKKCLKTYAIVKATVARISVKNHKVSSVLQSLLWPYFISKKCGQTRK